MTSSGARQASEGYSAVASAYDLFAAPYRPVQLAALDRLIERIRPGGGPVLDIGAGTGALSAIVLERVPDARVVALEPDPAMRALALSRVAAHPEWYERITVRPEDFFSATLPAQISAAILVGVLGHFDPGERQALFAELAARLPADGATHWLLRPSKPSSRAR